MKNRSFFILKPSPFILAVVLAGLVVATAVLAVLPGVALGVAGRGLQADLAGGLPFVRVLQVRATPAQLDEGLYGRLSDLLGPLLGQRVAVNEFQLEDGEQTLFGADGERQFDEYLFAHLWSFEKWEELVEVVDGRLPTVSDTPGVIEVAIGPEAQSGIHFSRGVGTVLSRTDVQIGDELAFGAMRFRVVGVVRPNGRSSDVWLDSTLPFGFLRQSLNGPNQPQTVTISLLVPPASMTAFPERTAHWRILLNSAAVTVDKATAVRQAIGNAQVQLGVTMETQLLPTLEKYHSGLAQARVTLLLLTAQSGLFVLFVLGMLSAFWLDEVRREVATLAGRGFSTGQITRIFAGQAGVLALIATLVGPLVGWLALRAWGQWTATAVPRWPGSDSWGLAITAAFFGWLTLVGGVYSAARGNILDWQRQLARPEQWAWWQKIYADWGLLALGGLIYGQLRATGSVQSGQGVDVLLLLGPSLLLVAVALVFLRLWPLTLRLAAAWAQRGTGLVRPFALWKLARDPIGPSRVLLLVSLASALSLFASLWGYSLQQRQAQMAHYQVGADVVLQVAVTADEAVFGEMAAQTGVTASAPVYRNERVRVANNLGRQVELIAVDPANFDKVATFAPFISELTMAQVLPALTLDPNSPAIPALFSRSALVEAHEIGDKVAYVVGTMPVIFEIRGFLQNFPAVTGPFLIANLPALEQKVDFGLLTEPWTGRKEAWLAVEAGATGQVVGELAPFGVVLGSAESREAAMAGDLVAQEAMAAFRLNGGVLLGLSVGLFWLVHFFAARSRRLEFAILQAGGLSPMQLWGLLSLEGGILTAVGLLVGAGIGYGLAVGLRPFLAPVLATAVGGDSVREIAVPWAELLGLYSFMLLAYGGALLLSLAFLRRAGLQNAMRVGEE